MASRTRQSSSDDVLIISDDSSLSFVDLTQESPAGASPTFPSQRGQPAHFFTASSAPSSTANEIVDLTCGDSSPVTLDLVTPDMTRTRSRRPQRATRRSLRRHSPYASNDIIIDSDEENDVQVLSPVDINNTLPWPDLSIDPASPPSNAAASTPGRKQVKCPVCMDNENQIRASGLQLTSTICGHIFCNRCIRGAIQTQHRCPTCRHKLTMRQIHPIFL